MTALVKLQCACVGSVSPVIDCILTLHLTSEAMNGYSRLPEEKLMKD